MKGNIIFAVIDLVSEKNELKVGHHDPCPVAVPNVSEKNELKAIEARSSWLIG
ncbi:hypothetical protein [Thermofilum sp.]